MDETSPDNVSPPEQPQEGGGLPWASLALYALGVLTGILLVALFGLAGGRLPIGPTAASGDMRVAARDGTLDAIATLEARANQPPTPAPTPTIVPGDAFTIREANAQGDPNAPVLLVEYSDFQ
jgi:hypothetical protein